MKKTRFTDEQMVAILREADEKAVPEMAKKHGVAAQTILRLAQVLRPLEPSDVKRLRQLEQENGRLKKMVADRDLEIDVLKEITRKKWWAHACAGSRSRSPERAACRAAARALCWRSPVPASGPVRNGPKKPGTSGSLTRVSIALIDLRGLSLSKPSKYRRNAPAAPRGRSPIQTASATSAADRSAPAHSRAATPARSVPTINSERRYNPSRANLTK